MRHLPAVYRSLALLGLCSWLVGCHKWAAMDEPYAESITAEQPEQIRITIAGTTRTETTASGRGAPARVVVGETVELRDPAIVGDSIKGSIEGPPDGIHVATLIPAAVPLELVFLVEERTTDAPATVLATFGIVLGALFAMTAIYALTCPPSDFLCGRD